MKISLLGPLNFDKLRISLSEIIEDQDIIEQIINEIELNSRKRKSDIVASAGRLSRYPGSVYDILEQIEDRPFEKNVNFIKKVIDMGHDSITDHDYCVFAVQDVSPIIEQTVIEERFSSFTIKSRREVDFSTVGFYTPDFHDENGNIVKDNERLKNMYNTYMQSLFEKYTRFKDKGVNMEDSRFVLPYCYHSNFFMGVDSHTLKDMIIKFTKTKYSKIQELREFGNRLYEIAKQYCPYIIDEIDKVEYQENDSVDLYLNSLIKDREYETISSPILLSSSNNIDDTILISAIMRRYQYDYAKAKEVYKKLCDENPDFKMNLMKKIAFEGDKLELSQVSFEFQIPISFAILTHLTRHRTHHIMVPDFVPIVDLFQYKVPPKIQCNEELKDLYDDVYTLNKMTYDKFKLDNGICDEDLVYFTLSGNTCNVVSNFDGKTIEHILKLRECGKAQWETQAMARGIHNEISKLEGAEIYSSILGATCMTQGVCNEGKESCGRIRTIKKTQ